MNLRTEQNQIFYFETSPQMFKLNSFSAPFFFFPKADAEAAALEARASRRQLGEMT